jgi:DNA replication and repair protein RecF
MYFRGTYFRDFRNLRGERREWSPGFNVIAGPNGSGKTNFLEGLNLMAGWGPFERRMKISGVIRWDSAEKEHAESALLWGGVCGEESSEVLASLHSRCQLKCDGKLTGAAEMRRKIPMLSFMAWHMSLLKGGASYRRQLLDMIGALVSVPYARVLHDYRLILRQKAVLLRNRRDPRAADRLLVSLGSWLWAAREEILRMLKREIDKFSELLPRPVDFFFKRGGGGLDENPTDDFKKSLRLTRERESLSRQPLVGPQRDDVGMTCGGMEAAAAFSMGQSKRVASALILASASVVEHRIEKKPVMIFDEITSELDESGRFLIMEILRETGYQVFAATTDIPAYGGIEIYKMSDGKFL